MRPGGSDLPLSARTTRASSKESKFILINHLQGQTYFRKQKAQLQKP